MGCLLRKHSPLRRGERGPPAIDPNVGGVLIIYINHPAGNLVQKHKTVRFDVVGEQPATKYPQISVTDLKDWKNGFASIHSPVFWSRPKRKCANHLIFQPKFSCLRAARISQFLYVNCNLVACKTTIFCNLTVSYADRAGAPNDNFRKNICSEKRFEI